MPGIGPQLAERIHDSLHIDSLEELEIAAHDGRLQDVPWVGGRRCKSIAASLAVMLGQRHRRQSIASNAIPVAVLLDIDRDYRDKAAAGKLPRIAPKRFNPKGLSWLPVMHEQYGDWNVSVLFSNTALAHKLDRTRDWVVIYYYDGDHQEGQNTVVTETRGALEGKRVVRGRERECQDYYSTQ